MYCYILQCSIYAVNKVKYVLLHTAMQVKGIRVQWIACYNIICVKLLEL